MTPLEAIGLVGVVASIIGLALAVIYARREAAKVKDLRYDTRIARTPLISSTRLSGYGVSIAYGSGVNEERVENLYVHHVVILNLGKESIRREDIAPSNPPRVVVEGARVLDVSLKSSTRDVINFSVADPEHASNSTFANVSFDYLDNQDGGLIRVLTTEHPKSLSLVGDIVGMPEGIRRVGEGKRADYWGRAAGIGAALLFAASLVSAVAAYRWATGGWADVWVLILPIVALVLPLAVIVLISSIWPSGEPAIPAKIRPSVGRITHLYGEDITMFERMEILNETPDIEGQNEAP